MTIDGRLGRRAMLPRLPAGYMLVTSGLVLRAVFQAVLTILLARMLGGADYGAYISVASVTGLFAVLAGLGASVVHLKETAIDPACWAQSFVRNRANVLRTLPPIVLISLAVAWFVVRGHVNVFTLGLLVCGEAVAMSCVDLLVRSYQGRGKHAAMAAAMSALPLCRGLLVAAVVVAGAGMTLFSWGIISAVVGSASLVVVFLVVSPQPPDGCGHPDAARSEMFSGIGFAMASASARIHADADKAIIGRIQSLQAAGEYSLAYRLIDVALLPINGMLEWTMRYLFVQGRASAIGSLRRLWRRWMAVTCLAIIAALAVYVAAPVLPVLFGSQYTGLPTIARWLCILPLTSAAWMVARGVAATSGHEKLVGMVEMLGAAASLILGIILVSMIGWRGAVLATYVVQAAMVAGLATVAILGWHQHGLGARGRSDRLGPGGQA
ncbi:polysaccharide biosynthesis protein [Mizugakiibacter sediminis]|uniref:Polysaccharide biosynthesis protein n=1 Tax=Mizugakiibacter sediminis TaxID=1475481 RepID=A0A0K8QKL4_9GAMM|nr:oligosaccharide flippase family protein [Mizugakiibacter sediminis]GAP65027.1 polysaccharide biosynthesis protein [Mizugakiibacter sediminis]